MQLRKDACWLGTAMLLPEPTRFLPQARPLERLAWRQLPSVRPFSAQLFSRLV
jgi:hypothetical protein